MAHSKIRPAVVLAVVALCPLAGTGQSDLKREGDSWVRFYTGTLPVQPRLRIEGHGPVMLEAGVATTLSYTVKVSVSARSEAQARRMLERAMVRIAPERGSTTLMVPGGQVLSTVSVRAPRLSGAAISTTQGGVSARGIDGTLTVTAVGELHVDRVGGECWLSTDGGDVSIGEVRGPLHCSTRAGRIDVKVVRGEAVLATDGGDVSVAQAYGPVDARTGGGTIHVVSATGGVTAITGGGEIVVDRAGGVVTARNLLGPVQIGAAAGVHCENASGVIRVSNITGVMRVSTAMGSIFANLTGSHLADSLLATGNGDITVVIPSNVGVTVRADNEMADTVRRIVSDFPTVRPARQNSHLVAQGPVNGGGPLLQIAAAGGTIYLRRR